MTGLVILLLLYGAYQMLKTAAANPEATGQIGSALWRWLKK